MLVRGEDKPELLYQTGRFILGAYYAKHDSQLLMQFETATIPPFSNEELRHLTEAEIGELLFHHAFLRGIIAFDVAMMPAIAHERIFVDGFASFGLSPDETRLIVQRQTPQGFETDVVDERGQAWRVEGVGHEGSPGSWIPDSSGLVMRDLLPFPSRAALLYLVPLSGDSAVNIDIGSPFFARQAWHGRPMAGHWRY